MLKFKKVFSFIIAAALMATMAPAAFAGGSAASISIVSNYGGYVSANHEATLMKFKVHANQDIHIDGVRVDIDGSGANFVNNVYLENSNGYVLDSVDSTTSHYLYPSVYLDAGEEKIFVVKADIDSDASTHKNLSFDVSIENVFVENPNTGYSFSTYPEYLDGGEFNFGGLVSADGAYSNFTAVASNRVVNPGESVRLSSFSIGYKNALTLEHMDVEIAGNGASGVDRVYLKDEYGNIIDSKLLNSYAKVTFNTNEYIAANNSKKFNIWVSTNSDAVVGTKISVKMTDLDLRTNNGDLMWVGNDVPYTENAFVFVENANNYVADLDALYVSGERSGVVLGDDYESVFAFKLKTDELGVDVSSIVIEASGSLLNDIDRVKLVSNGYTLDTATLVDASSGMNNGKYIFEFDERSIVHHDYKTFYVWVDLKNNFDNSQSAVFKLSDVEAETFNNGEVDVDGLPLTSYTFFSEAANNVNPPNNGDDYEEEFNGDNPFSDMSAAEAQTLRGRAAIYLASRKIIMGYLVSESPLVVEFRGNNELNRAQAVKFIVNSLNLPDSEYSNNHHFDDVALSSWYSKYVSTAYDLGIVNGYSDGSFKPGQTVNKVEFVKMLVVAHGLNVNNYADANYYDTDSNAWYSQYVNVAAGEDLFPEDNHYFEPSKVLNRWETSVAVYQLLVN